MTIGTIPTAALNDGSVGVCGTAGVVVAGVALGVAFELFEVPLAARAGSCRDFSVPAKAEVTAPAGLAAARAAGTSAAMIVGPA